MTYGRSSGDRRSGRPIVWCLVDWWIGVGAEMKVGRKEREREREREEETEDVGSRRT